MDKKWKEKIEEDIRKNDIMVYIRGTPQAPRCGFTTKVIRVLEDLGREYGYENMDSDRALWNTLKELNNWPTSPQIYVKGEFIGGCDIFCEMYKNGELQSMLGIK